MDGLIESALLMSIRNAITTLATANSHISGRSNDDIVILSVHIEHIRNDIGVGGFTEVENGTEHAYNQ